MFAIVAFYEDDCKRCFTTVNYTWSRLRLYRQENRSTKTKGARGADVSLLSCLVIKQFSQFLLPFALLSLLLENGEFIK